LHTGMLRPGAKSDDWFHAVLEYPSLRVVLHATVVAAQPSPRYVVHGLHGSYVKEGMDPQEDALKAGGVPGTAGWGVDPRPGTLTNAEGQRRLVEGVPGAYQTYYAAFRDALSGLGPVPVDPRDAVRVMRGLELGLLSTTAGRQRWR